MHDGPTTYAIPSLSGRFDPDGDGKTYLDGCWNLNYVNTYVFRVPAEKLLPFVPSGHELMVEDGMGTIEFGFMMFDGTNLPTEPNGFQELSFAMAVRPTRSPNPKSMAWFTLTLTSSSAHFLDDCEQRVKFPVYRPRGFRFELTHHDVTVRTDDGPILTMRTDKKWWFHVPASATAEVYSRTSDVTYDFSFTGWFGLSNRSKATCEFHQHPFFDLGGQKFDTDAIIAVPKTVYTARPGCTGRQKFLPPKR